MNIGMLKGMMQNGEKQLSRQKGERRIIGEMPFLGEKGLNAIHKREC